MNCGVLGTRRFSGGIVSNGNLLDFEFDSLTGWTLDKAGDDTCTVTTEEGYSVFKHDSVTDDDGYINYYKDSAFSASSTGTMVATWRLKHALLDSYAAGTKVVQVLLGITATRRAGLNIYSDGFGIINTSGATIFFPVTGIPQGSFYELTGVWNLSALTVDLYINSVQVITGASSGAAVSALGQFSTFSRSRPTGYIRNYQYFDRLRVGDGIA